MTAVEQRDLIVQACRWDPPLYPSTLAGWTKGGERRLSDPLTDLEAMLEARQILLTTPDRRQLYLARLLPLLHIPAGLAWNGNFAYRLTEATAAQQAAALTEVILQQNSDAAELQAKGIK